MIFAKRIREKRLKLEKTIEQVAVDCECSAGYIRNLEKGNSTTPSIALIKKLEACLKLSGLANQVPALVADRVKEVQNPTVLKMVVAVLEADKSTLRQLKESVFGEVED